MTNIHVRRIYLRKWTHRKTVSRMQNHLKIASSLNSRSTKSISQTTERMEWNLDKARLYVGDKKMEMICIAVAQR